MADAAIFEALIKDHDLHRTLLAKIADSEADEERQALFEQFRVEVTAHAAAEEESLYATMLAKPDLREEAQHSVAEHKEIEDFLKELGDLEIGKDAWDATFKHMMKRYLHHIDEEEEEMFPTAEDGLSGAEEKRLAGVFKRRKPAELRQAKSDA
jgi:hemerythrin superfamily protein